MGSRNHNKKKRVLAMKISWALCLGLASGLSKTEKRVEHGAKMMREKSMSFLAPDGNSIISPLSIMGAMYLTAACTKPDSDSERQIVESLWGLSPVSKNDNKVGNEPYLAFREMEKFLSSSGDNERSVAYTLKLANGIFFQKGVVNLEKAKKSNPMKFFAQGDSTIQAHDFRNNMTTAISAINKWADQSTRGKIPTLFETLDHDTLLVMASSLYFKSSWKNPFKSMRNDQVKAYNLCWLSQKNDECNNDVEWIMQQSKFHYLELTDMGITMQIIEVPLGNNKFSDKDMQKSAKLRNDMMVQFWYLKNDFMTNGDNDKLVQAFIAKYADKVRTGKVGKKLMRADVKLILPKLSMNTEIDLVEQMKENGINAIFDAATADFSPILGDDRAEISQIKHKVKFDMNEDGVEGAAITASVLSRLVCRVIREIQTKVTQNQIIPNFCIYVQLILFLFSRYSAAQWSRPK